MNPMITQVSKTQKVVVTKANRTLVTKLPAQGEMEVIWCPLKTFVKIKVKQDPGMASVYLTFSREQWNIINYFLDDDRIFQMLEVHPPFRNCDEFKQTI